jgi:primosomal protein N'
MQAKVVIVGASRGVDQLSYEVPAAMAESLRVGHRVLVPLRSRRVTGVVLEVSPEPASELLKPILEILEPRPLFDEAHLKLLEFLASYYMTALGDAYRSVIPSVARVESRMAYRVAMEPSQLRAAALSKVERRIVEVVSERPASMKRIEKLGPPREVRAAVARLSNEGIIARQDSARSTGRAAGEDARPQAARSVRQGRRARRDVCR